MPTYDPDFDWGTPETGLPSDFVAQLQSPEFSFHPDHNEGKTLALRMKLQLPEGGEYNNRLSTGTKWETIDNGRGVQREDGRQANFHQSTGIGVALTKMKENGVDVNQIVRDRQANPTMVEFWDGLVCHWDTVHNDGNAEKNIPPYDTLVPFGVEGYGGVGFDGSAPAPAASTPAATPPAATPTAAPVKGAAKKGGSTPAPAAGGSAVDPAIVKAIYRVAYDQAETFEQFQELCLTQVPAAVDDPAVTALVENGGEGSIWQQAVADFEAGKDSHPA